MRALAGLLAVGSAAVVVSLLGELFARYVLRSTHVVYYLVGRSRRGVAGTVLYVGETTNYRLRYREHLDPNEHPDEWRRRVDNMAVVRYTWGYRQACRIERRMIRSVSLAARWRMCPPVHNHQHNVYARELPGGGQRWPSLRDVAWLAVYRLNGVLWPAARWHGPNPAGLVLTPPHGRSNGVGDAWAAQATPRSRSAAPVITDDRPLGAPLGARSGGDMSPAGDTVTAGPLLALPAAPPVLRVVPADEEEPLPTDEPARTRERNRRNKAAERRRAREASQDRAAG